MDEVGVGRCEKIEGLGVEGDDGQAVLAADPGAGVSGYEVVGEVGASREPKVGWAGTGEAA